ncbi:MAG: RelA/SpoT family protein [Anaerolineae bacterium]|nr:RelA/SpoT family protein [Anaerolineae bacterium]
MTATENPQLQLNELIDALPGGVVGGAGTRVLSAYATAKRIYAGRPAEQKTLLEHAIGVAITLFDLGMDIDTLVAAMLIHTPLESDTLDEIEAQFGRNVTDILRNLNKLDKYTEGKQSASEHTLEAIRRAVLTIVAGDVRVVLIRLAICLQDLIVAKSASAEQQQAVALDARNIYAPLANRLGIWQLKWELEDLAFRYLQPEEFKTISKALSEKRDMRNARVKSARDKLSEHLGREGIRATVTGRPKHIYSIYRKMERKRVSFSEINDAQALRVIINEDDPEKPGLTDEQRKQANYTQCYRALAVVHDIWDAMPEEYDDYIQHPKPNGYRSLHTTVRDESKHRLEVQIRTQQMHAEAEQGIAAHWAYKEGGRPSPALARQIESLRNLLGTMVTTAEHDEINESIGEEVLADRIFVLTPKGDVLDLPLGATPLDFAYMVHSQVGHRTRGAKVNGKMVSLTYQLQTGDRVEIITAKQAKPSRDWMNPNAGYTASARTRSRIRQWFRKNEREQNIEYGRAAVEREMKQYKLGKTVSADDLARHFKIDKTEDFLAKVGFGDITTAQVGGALALLQRDMRANLAAENDTDVVEIESRHSEPDRPKHKGLTVLGVAGLHTTIAACCRPIPPEPIVGYITRGRGITIHHIDCKQVQAKLVREPERIIEDVDWGSESGTFSVPYTIEAYRDTNLVTKIADILKGQNINLLKTKMTHKQSGTSAFVLAEVNDLEQANWIKGRLEKIDTVITVRSR